MTTRTSAVSKQSPAADGLAAIRMLENFQRAQNSVEVTDRKGEAIPLHEMFSRCILLLREVVLNGKKVIFIGNGGSAAIASHQAVDFWKNGQIEALAFNDSSLLTCISNDFSYEEVFAKPIQRFAKPGDFLVAISSSGKSPNILNGATVGRQMECRLLTLSGFEPTNPLRKMGEMNLYVPSKTYGVVEGIHLAMLHALLESYTVSGSNGSKE